MGEFGTYSKDDVILIGISPYKGSSYVDEIEIVLNQENGNSMSIKFPYSGYDMQLFLGDFTGNNRSDIMVRGEFGGSGGFEIGVIYKYENGKFVVDEEKVELVNNIFLSYIETKSIIGVSRQFGLSEAGVRHLLENRTYIGELPHGRTLYNLYGDKIESELQFFKGQHEAIVPLDIFEEVQKIRSMSYKTYSSKDHKAIILFSGIVKCTCGGKMHQCNTSKEKAIYYKCNSCGKMIVSHKIEKIILEELFKMKEIKTLNDVKLNQNKDKFYEKSISSSK